jgi:hypothetical protein
LSGSAYQRGQQLLHEGELADAIWAFMDELQENPEEPAGYFALMEAYQLAYTVFPDPQLLQQVKNVLVGARHQDLDQEQERLADEIERAIDAEIQALAEHDAGG